MKKYLFVAFAAAAFLTVGCKKEEAASATDSSTPAAAAVEEKVVSLKVDGMV